MNTFDRAVAPPPSNWSLFRPYFLDIVAPFFGYLVVRALGASGVWALSLAGVAAGIGTAVNTVRRKGLDAVGLLVILEIIASILILLFVRNERLFLIRPSFYTGIAALYLMISAFRGKPLSYAGSRAMAAKGGPARIAAYERAWTASPKFRRIHTLVTFGFGIGLALDSILRVIIVYRFPTDRASWLSNVPHVTAIILMVAISALAGRKFSKLVDEQMQLAGAMPLQALDDST